MDENKSLDRGLDALLGGAKKPKGSLEIDLKKLPTRTESYFVFADLPHNKFSNEKAKNQLNWQPKYNLKDVWSK